MGATSPPAIPADMASTPSLRPRFAVFHVFGPCSFKPILSTTFAGFIGSCAMASFVDNSCAPRCLSSAMMASGSAGATPILVGT